MLYGVAYVRPHRIGWLLALTMSSVRFYYCFYFIIDANKWWIETIADNNSASNTDGTIFLSMRARVCVTFPASTFQRLTPDKKNESIRCVVWMWCDHPPEPNWITLRPIESAIIFQSNKYIFCTRNSIKRKKICLFFRCHVCRLGCIKWEWHTHTTHACLARDNKCANLFKI